MNLSVKDNLIFFESMNEPMNTKVDKVTFYLEKFKLHQRIDYKV